MAKRSFAVLALAFALVGPIVVHADSSEDGKSDKSSEQHLKKKHEALEGQAKAERVQRQQMQELKQIQQKEQLKEQLSEEQKNEPVVAKDSPSTEKRSHLWRRGAQVPADFAEDKSHWIEDWQQHSLSEPGQDKRWLQVKSGFVLMDIKTSVIEEIVLGQ
ncbi:MULTISPECIES: RcnB family protein [Cobetia]|uniref:RcnB family protein n=1 Tax=Cobetia crustatorum TaxID=553385 RepID=A0A558HLW9_9GAMM|nr:MULTISPECIES: RcnB family protein [Cobetia]TVU70115.1 hypothetical protein FQP86_09950 [Cobetia crustatorum]